MFVDDYGHEFKTEKEIEDFARKEFYKEEDALIIALEDYLFDDYLLIEDVLKWILKNNREKFLKDFENVFKGIETNYIRDYFIIHDIEEM